MKKITTVSISSGLALLAPLLAFAQLTGTLDQKVNGFGRLLNNSIIPILVALAIIYFFWGVIKYVISAGDDEARKNARGIMIYGVIGLFVMVSIWGLVNLLQGTFGVQGGNAGVTTPGVPPTSNI